jgi:Ca2+-binding EF-hand superfamily protein
MRHSFLWMATALSLAGVVTSAPAQTQRPKEEIAIELLQRWDTNRDGLLTTDEIPARARPGIERLSREAGLRMDEGLPLDRVSQYLRKQKPPSGRPAARTNESPPADRSAPSESDPGDAKPASPERAPAGFGTAGQRAEVKSFGATAPSTDFSSESRSEKQPGASPRQEPADGREPNRTNPDERVRRYAEVLLRRYDRNRNGVLEQEEWSRMRGDPARSDTNQDGILTVEELTVQLSAYSRSSQTASQPRAATTTAESRPAVGNRAPREGRRFATATERLAETLPRELLDWFLQKDRDGDGQVAMWEFSSVWSGERVREFAQLDLDNDGLITPREYTRAKTGR